MALQQKSMTIPIAKPEFDQADREALLKPLESGWVVQGPSVAEFERLIATYTQTQFAVATSSCTTALHLSLLALGLKPGEKVVLPAFTWVSCANVIEHCGAIPIFCDIELDTFTIDIKKLEELLAHHKEVRVVMPVHLFGAAADMSSILSLAKTYHFKIVEDAACALGSFYDKKHVGGFGDTGCFSFHPRKIITTGEGGVLVTNNEEIATHVKSLRDHGAQVSDHARHTQKNSTLPDFPYAGYHYRMTDFQAALGVSQFNKFAAIQKKRLALVKRYQEALARLDGLTLPKVPTNQHHSFQAYVCLVTKNRDLLMAKLAELGITTRPGTHAIHSLDFYKKKYGFKPEDFANAYAADQLSIALPLYASMTGQEQDYVINNFTRLIKEL